MGNDSTREEPTQHAFDHWAQGAMGACEVLGPHAQELLEVLLRTGPETVCFGSVPSASGSGTTLRMTRLLGAEGLHGVEPGARAETPPSVVGRRVFVRNDEEAVAVDVEG